MLTENWWHYSRYLIKYNYCSECLWIVAHVNDVVIKQHPHAMTLNDADVMSAAQAAAAVNHNWYQVVHSVGVARVVRLQHRNHDKLVSSTFYTTTTTSREIMKLIDWHLVIWHYNYPGLPIPWTHYAMPLPNIDPLVGILADRIFAWGSTFQSPLLSSLTLFTPFPPLLPTPFPQSI